MNKSIYKIGDIVVDTDYENATFERFLKWRESFLSDIEGIDMDISLVGNTALKFYGNVDVDTFDVDILIYKKYPECEELNTVFKSAILRGAENKLFIDISFLGYDFFKYEYPLYPHNMMIPYVNFTYKNGDIIEVTGRYEEFCKGIYYKNRKNLDRIGSLNKTKKAVNAGEVEHLNINLRTLQKVEWNL